MAQSMTPSEFEGETLRFAAYPDAGRGTVTEFTYLGLAVAGEAGEYLEVISQLNSAQRLRLSTEDYRRLQIEQLYELGDVTWYVARIAVACGSSFDTFVKIARDFGAQRSAEDSDIVIGYTGAKIADFVKKMLRADPDMDRLRDDIIEASLRLLCGIIQSAEANGTTLEEILWLNRDKLAKRYGAGKAEGGGTV